MGFKIAGNDLVGGGRGAPLPNGTYRVTVEHAGVETKENGTQITRQYGNIRVPNGSSAEFELPDGGTYRIGNRKVFARSWWDQKNEQAAAIGQRELAREAIAAGLMPAVAKGEEADFPFDSPEAYAEAVTGKELLIKTRLKARNDKQGKPVKDDEGNAVLEPQVVEWLAL